MPITDAELVDRAKDLLAKVDPREADQFALRGAQYDAGLAWVHFGPPRERRDATKPAQGFLASWQEKCRFGGGHFVAGVRAGQRPAPDDKRE